MTVHTVGWGAPAVIALFQAADSSQPLVQILWLAVACVAGVKAVQASPFMSDGGGMRDEWRAAGPVKRAAVLGGCFAVPILLWGLWLYHQLTPIAEPPRREQLFEFAGEFRVVGIDYAVVQAGKVAILRCGAGYDSDYWCSTKRVSLANPYLGKKVTLLTSQEPREGVFTAPLYELSVDGQVMVAYDDVVSRMRIERYRKSKGLPSATIFATFSAVVGFILAMSRPRREEEAEA